jgi:threonine dehydrogenase-like Zn-dependent dehydrogenase
MPRSCRKARDRHPTGIHGDMRAAIFNGPHDVSTGDRPDPRIQEPTDAIVRVTLSCVCGSDLWYYRGVSTHDPGAIGHEFIGIVEEVGGAVRTIKPGQLVVAPFKFSDGTCFNCRYDVTSACVNGAAFGNGVYDGGQGESLRVPLADGTLVAAPARNYEDETLKSLLALSDVMGTGHHVALSGNVNERSTVAVVGDGAVGLCAVLASKRLGASRVIALSRHPQRQALAREFGATDIVEARGDDAVDAVLDLTDGVGVDSALESVGSGESFATAFGIARAGGSVGFVGVPHDVEVPLGPVMFARNVGLRGGAAPVRAYLPELMADVLRGAINPGRVFDYETDLEHVADAYAAMDERRAIKALLRIS